MNLEYDLARPLQSALKAKAPYVGIPIPGHAPLIFNRLFLVRVLQGVKPVNIEVLTNDSGDRWLKVDGVINARCRTSFKTPSIPRARVLRYGTERDEMDKWRPTITATPKPRTTKWEKAIVQLEKKLAKLGERPKIFNPAIATGRVAKDYTRENRLKWRAQTKLRGRIGALAAKVRAGKLTARELYVELAKFTTVKRYSDLTAYQRKNVKTFHDFVDPKRLWKFLPDVMKECGDVRMRLYWHREDEPDYWGAKRYYPALNWSNERRELLSQIQAVRDMMETALLIANH